MAGVIEGKDSVFVVTDEWGDTTHIKVGNLTYKVIEGTNSAVVKEVKDATEVKVGKKNVVTVVDGSDQVHVVVGNKENGKGIEVLTDDWGDTTHIRVGRRTFKVIEGDNGTYVKYEKEDKYLLVFDVSYWTIIGTNPSSSFKNSFCRHVVGIE